MWTRCCLICFSNASYELTSFSRPEGSFPRRSEEHVHLLVSAEFVTLDLRTVIIFLWHDSVLELLNLVRQNKLHPECETSRFPPSTSLDSASAHHEFPSVTEENPELSPLRNTKRRPEKTWLEILVPSWLPLAYEYSPIEKIEAIERRFVSPDAIDFAISQTGLGSNKKRFSQGPNLIRSRVAAASANFPSRLFLSGPQN